MKGKLAHSVELFGYKILNCHFRCEYVHGHQVQEISIINDSNFIYPYYSTLQEDMLKLMKIEPDVVLELPNLVTMPLHSWIVDQR